MTKKSILGSRVLTGFLSLSMILTAVPVSSVFAEDIEYDDEVIEVDYGIEDGEVTVDDTATFIVKKFKKFAKEDGVFKDHETLEKYGNLTAMTGTPLKELGLPKDLTLVGYWDYADPDDPIELELKKIGWTLDEDKYAEWEYYDEYSPADVYTFIPDFKTYCEDHDDIDEIVLAENAKMLKLDVMITDPAEEVDDTEEETELSAEEIIYKDGTLDDGEIVIPDELIFDDELILGEEDDMIEEDSIFDHLDDDLLSSDFDEEDFLFDEPEQDGIVVIVDDEEETETETETETEAETEEDLEDDLADLLPAYGVDLEGFLGLTDGFKHYNDTTTTTLTTEEENDITLSGIPCGIDLTDVTLLLDGTPLVDELDLSSGEETVFSYTDDDDNEYVIVLKVSQNAHAWSDAASCTDPAVCLNCGKESGVTGHHTPAGEATCLENDYCTVCYEEIPDTKLGHDWKAATCKKPKTCKRCGITKGEKLGHVNAGDATCTENATCERCGKEIAGSALDHSWRKATCTKPRTCKRCGETDGKPLGHHMGDWTVVEKSTESTHGIQRRYCQRKGCDKYEESYLNIIPDPSYNYIWGIEEGADYEPKTRIAFTAVGAGNKNTKPISGDVRYIPSTWSIQGQPGNFLDGYEGAFSISQKGTYNVTVSFQKQIFDGEVWNSTDVADSKTVTFTIGGVKDNGTTNAVHINPQTGDSTPIIPIVLALVAALAGIIGVVLFKTRKK